MTNAYDNLNKHYQEFLIQREIWNAEQYPSARQGKKAVYAFNRYVKEFERLTNAGMVPITY